MNYAKKINSPIGELFIVANEQAIISLDNIKTSLYLNATQMKMNNTLNECHNQLDEYFKGKRVVFDLPLEPIGTPFQKKAWKALSQIPFGDVWSYGQQAKFLKAPKAFRAVGAANGKNPIPIIIPCHRVIGSTGKLTGYSGGMEMKISLLKLEGHEIKDLKILFQKD